MTTMNIEKHDHHGEFVLTYPGEVLEQGETWVCLRAVFDRSQTDLGFVIFQPGDVFYEWFFSDHWYNIFQVHDGATETIKGWYCNITRPAHIEANRVSSDDLELDVFVMPNGTIILLDEAEFAALNLATDERMAALHAIQNIRQRVSSRDLPFTAIL